MLYYTIAYYTILQYTVLCSAMLCFALTCQTLQCDALPKVMHVRMRTNACPRAQTGLTDLFVGGQRHVIACHTRFHTTFRNLFLSSQACKGGIAKGERTKGYPLTLSHLTNTYMLLLQAISWLDPLSRYPARHPAPYPRRRSGAAMACDPPPPPPIQWHAHAHDTQRVCHIVPYYIILYFMLLCCIVL